MLLLFQVVAWATSSLFIPILLTSSLLSALMSSFLFSFPSTASDIDCVSSLTIITIASVSSDSPSPALCLVPSDFWILGF